jgi:peptide/nickel transport system substrate-binding protein
MKYLGRLLMAGTAALLSLSLVIPVVAQDKPPGAGQGGIIIEGTYGSDPVPFNPLVCSESSCIKLAGLMLPALVYVDPTTANFGKSGPGAMATGWTVSDDGLTYTFTLRKDYKWNDGTPITSKDFLYSWNAIKSGKLENTLYSSTPDIVDSMSAPDDTTLVVKMKNAECTALGSASIPPLPSHILPADPVALNTADWNLDPTVTGGPFKFGEYRASELVSLVADQNYPDASAGFVSPAGYIMKNVPDANVLLEQFLAGETNYIEDPVVGRRADVRDAGTAGKVQVYSDAGNFWDYFAFNLADPKNPKNGTDDKGNVIPQGYHPIFGNKEVRQAIAKAIDIDAIIQKAVFGEGTRMPSYITTTSWAFNKALKPIAYDPKAAGDMLDKVGWVLPDNKPGSIRVAKGVKLPDGTSVPDGTPMSFTMIGNQGNTRRAAEGELIQDQLHQIGIDGKYQAIDFGTWQDQVNAQTFDVAMLAWQEGYPADPDGTQLWTPAGDVIGSGNNSTSFYNKEFVDLNTKARTLPGCDQTERAKIYAHMQEIMQDEMPYVWMYSINGMRAAAANVHGFHPYPGNSLWNLDSWYVQ